MDIYGLCQDHYGIKPVWITTGSIIELPEMD
jgi:hypothetical protein